MWSGPRNISTALMRSWENRPDAVVVDEPLYAYYLATTGLDHPGRDEVVATGETDWRRVVDMLLGPVPPGTALFYQKHMTGHLLPEVDRGWVRDLTNVILIRDPREVVASYTKARQTITPEDIGLPQQVRLYDELAADGLAPPVVDAADFLRDPASHLRALCAYAGVEFTDRMLHWPAGPRDSDGVWAKHWYATVEKSTGFEPYRPREPQLAGAAAEVAAACRPHYERLREHRLQL
ncbi:MAG: HAD family hydrolase [Streptosporangiales bacterium]|nr:HAD family hydrolase [Streptosporangiales bacterium]